MFCPECGSQRSTVIDSRDTKFNYFRRRRECLDCGRRFSTIEISEISTDIFTAIHRIMTLNGNNRYQFNKIIFKEYQKRFERRKYYND